MPAFPSPPGSDLPTTIAAWSAVVAATATLLLFASTLLLRLATVRDEDRRRAVVERWRGVFAGATLSESEARGCPLPSCRRPERAHLLEEWNKAAGAVEGESAANLVLLAGRLSLDALARKMLRRRKLGPRLLAVHTLGNLGDASAWDTLVSYLEHPSTALSVTSALALVQIDAFAATPKVMAQLVERTDWPPGTVSRILKTAGPALITQPLCHAILVSEPENAVRLLRFTESARTETVDQLVELVLRERDEPAVLAAALSAVSSQTGIPRLSQMVRHEAWYVRVQAAKLLGRVAEERELPWLERLLCDKEWWVRYRAAQAIVSLPFMSPNALRRLRDRQNDPFAADILKQAMAEVGLT